MAQIEQSVDVNVPITTAYNQWTQFEEFPQFMEGVEEVRQLDDTRLHWRAEIGGVEREWDAEITEQHPDQRIAWTSTSGTTNSGVVSFEQLSADTTRIMLQLDYEPDGVIEKAAELLGIVQRRARGDLDRFKDFIEGRGQETGAWRGDVSREDARL